MAKSTGIAWCDRTWSPWIGCTKISPACDGCYAAHQMDTRYGRVTWGPHGERVRTSEAYWRQLARWNREAEKAGRIITVFPSLCDPWDNAADPGIRREWFALIRETSHLLYLFLSKRPQNAVAMAEAAGGLPNNVALGATCEDRKRVEINLTALRDAEDLLRPNGQPTFTFASFEPLLEDVGDLTPWLYGPVPLGWAITGGETHQGQHRARPSHPAWFRSIRDQCRRACVPYHHKQNGVWGETATGSGFALQPDGRLAGPERDFGEVCRDPSIAWVDRLGTKATGRRLDGVEHNGMPEVRHVA